jgi:hypothetical protein
LRRSCHLVHSRRVSGSANCILKTNALRHEPQFEPLEIRHHEALPLRAERRLSAYRGSPHMYDGRGVNRRGEQ